MQSQELPVSIYVTPKLTKQTNKMTEYLYSWIKSIEQIKVWSDDYTCYLDQPDIVEIQRSKENVALSMNTFSKVQSVRNLLSPIKT